MIIGRISQQLRKSFRSCNLKFYFLAKFFENIFRNKNDVSTFNIAFENVSVLSVIESQGVEDRITISIFLTNNLNLIQFCFPIEKSQFLLLFVTLEERFEFFTHHLGRDSSTRGSFSHCDVLTDFKVEPHDISVRHDGAVGAFVYRNIQPHTPFYDSLCLRESWTLLALWVI